MKTGARDQTVTGIAVIIPAHNEQARLGRCIDSVHRALQQRDAREVPSLIVVVLDRCSDHSQQVVQHHLRPHDVMIEVSTRNVGAARAAGSAIALSSLAQLGGEPETCWLSHTDADTVVPPSWISRQIRYSAIADAVAGVVRVDDWSEHIPATRQHFTQHYRAAVIGGPPDSHPHVHGANLGIRASTYLAAGGFVDLACGEDHDLWDVLQSRGVTTLSTRRLWVTTSGRRTGRAPGGFADTLIALHEAG